MGPMGPWAWAGGREIALSRPNELYPDKMEPIPTNIDILYIEMLHPSHKALSRPVFSRNQALFQPTYLYGIKVSCLKCLA